MIETYFRRHQASLNVNHSHLKQSKTKLVAPESGTENMPGKPATQFLKEVVSNYSFFFHMLIINSSALTCIL